jgi:hypothetical protein
MQKMVMSLACDKAVWNAVMDNEAVQDFRRSLHDGTLNQTSRPSCTSTDMQMFFPVNQ